MTKCAILLFYATIAGCFYGLLAESPGSQAKLENIEEQLRTLRTGQERMERQLEALLQKLSRTPMALTKTGNFSKFESIGSSFYYIESENIVNWYGANDTCARLGGHLANYPNREELSLIKQRLPENIKEMNYWLNQPHSNRMFSPILKWEKNRLNDWIDYETEAAMTFSEMYFICEAEI